MFKNKYKFLGCSFIALCYASPAISFAQSPKPIQISISQQNTSQRIVLPKGKSAIIDLPVEARDVVVANPKIADAVMRTARRGFLLGSEVGETNVYFLDASGRQILSLDVRVARDSSELSALIQKLVPEARVKIDSVNDSVIISGSVPNPSVSDHVLLLAKQYAGGDDKVVNMMSVDGSQQVMLSVRIVEMQRSVIKQLGMNLAGSNLLNSMLPSDWGLSFATANGFSVAGSFLGGTTLGSSWAQNAVVPSSVTYNAATAGTQSILNAGAGGYSQSYDSTTGLTTTTYGTGSIVQTQSASSNLQALERVGLARTLAEPNLTALSGESAKFLAGGEYPVPVSAANNTVSVSFKQFGVGLAFTPVVLSPDRISLKISTEVSEISTANSYKQADTTVTNSDGSKSVVQGLSIPGISTRRAETTLEMPSGRSMMMAGLIQQATRQAIEGMPGMKDLPVLGNLFRSRDFANNETELVVIVTPYIVKSTTMDNLVQPGNGLTLADDANTHLLGRLNRIVKPSSTTTPDGKYEAPIGHVTQ